MHFPLARRLICSWISCLQRSSFLRSMPPGLRVVWRLCVADSIVFSAEPLVIKLCELLVASPLLLS